MPGVCGDGFQRRPTKPTLCLLLTVNLNLMKPLLASIAARCIGARGNIESGLIRCLENAPKQQVMSKPDHGHVLGDLVAELIC